jgi:hypothetical protein
MPWVFAHVFAFALGGSIAALVMRTPDDTDETTWRPDGAETLAHAGAALADEPTESAPEWEWAAEPAAQPAEFAVEGPAWSPQQIWERLALEDPAEYEPAEVGASAPAEEPAPRVIPATTEPVDEPRPRLPHRFAATATIVTMFFAGAALSAGAGDQVANLMESTTTTVAAEAPPVEETAPAPEAAPEAAPAPEAAVPEAAEPASEPAAADSSAASAPTGWADASSSTSSASSASGSTSAGSAYAPAVKPVSPRVRRARVVRAHQQWVAQQAVRRVKQQLRSTGAKADPEASMPGTASIVWLNRSMPDPTPAAKRLTDAFAHDLASTSKQAGSNWALVLGVLRAQGAEGRVPAGHATLRGLALRLANLQANGKTEWEAVTALTGDTTTADRAVALAHYNRAVGLWALVHGLEAAKGALTARMLADPRVDMYAGGRSDLENGRINVRVIALMSYLAESFGQVSVSCLEEGHRLYARPGVISAHMYGLAVDVSAVGGTSIQGHQEPGGITEQAVRQVLLLPSELQPKQVISLLGLGGPSFPLANHYDHIHVGY